jgi:hypothetical protein
VYLAAGRLVEALAWFGIVANCIVVAALAVDELRRGAVDLGSLPLRRRTFRDAVAREHPRLGRRTVALMAVGLVPYLLASAILVERLRPPAPSGEPGR